MRAAALILTLVVPLLNLSGHAAAQQPALALELIAEGLTAPVDLLSPPDQSGRRFVVEQTGVVHILDPAGQRVETPFLDLRSRMLPLTGGFEERGLLGFAFHPEFAVNGRFFVTYSAPLRAAGPAGWNSTRRVSEFTVAADAPDRADPNSERIILVLDWPSRKHNGGGLAFGPEGHLYVGIGDGGGVHGLGPETLFEAFDVPERLAAWDRLAQDLHSLYGKILRLDIDAGYPGYAVPQLNPLKGGNGRPEIYAWGFRNPYRFSFDGASLFVTAVGETLWESVYLVDRPGNFGWPVREATHCFDRLRPSAPPGTCPATGTLGEPLIDPIIEYPNMSVHRDDVKLGLQGTGTAVVGGHIYRGGAIPELRGRFVLGDWSRDFAAPSGQIFVAAPPARWGELWTLAKVLDLPGRVLSIGRDGAGELYVLTNDELGPYGSTGKVYKLVPAR